MTKRYFLNIITFVLLSLQLQAQGTGFSIKITQVYPAGGVVYGNTYNLSSELENAERQLRNQYTGKDANYMMELTRPSGKEIKAIQNINWILIENGVKKNLKTKPAVKDTYSQPTTIEIYACNNHGTKKNGNENRVTTYDCYYEFYINEKVVPNEINYQLLGKCKESAKTYFFQNKPKVDSVFCEIKVFKGKGQPIDTIALNNKKEHEIFKKSQENKVDSVKAQSIPKDTSNMLPCEKTLVDYDKKIKATKDEKKQSEVKDKAFSTAMECIVVDIVYNHDNIDKNLKLCLAATNYLTTSTFLSKLNSLIEKADCIHKIMLSNPNKISFSFDRNKYFETTNLKDLRTGINELIKINKTLK